MCLMIMPENSRLLSMAGCDALVFVVRDQCSVVPLLPVCDAAVWLLRCRCAMPAMMRVCSGGAW